MKKISKPLQHIVRLFTICLFIVLMSSCSDDTNTGSSTDNYETVTYNVAMIYPSGWGNSIDKLIQFAAQNAEEAQRGMKRRVVLNIEKYDEMTVNIDSLGKALALRDDIDAIVGPTYSSNMSKFAMQLENAGKPVISPWATSATLARDYAEKDFFWSLIESDITQCEMLISRALNYGDKKVSLITSSTAYGDTFNDWFAFQAEEMGLEVVNTYVYDHETDDVESMTKKALTDGCDALICIPEYETTAEQMLKAKSMLSDNTVQMLFSDEAHSDDLLKYGEGANYTEGICPETDPGTGFTIAYSNKYNELPYYPQFYDAMLILYAAGTSIDAGRADNLEDAIKDVVSKTNADGTSRPAELCWTSEGLSKELQGLRNGTTVYDITGASGDLDFNIDMQSSVLHSTYIHWMIYDGRFITLDYLTTEGSTHTDGTMPSWKWNLQNVQSFSDTETFTYPEHKDSWALVVATSYGWLNYRHQADALQVYRILKQQGYKDDHIILIMEDDLRYNSQNPDQGCVLSYYGDNLFTSDVECDYKLTDLQPDDITAILTGQSSERLPKVLSPTANDNVLVFWSGHGVKGALNWGANKEQECMTYDRMASLLKNMRDRGCYRKMLWLIETCYSASVALAASAEEIPGVMMITAANPNETSKADLFRDGIYYSDRFSRILYDAVKANPSITYRDLYYEMVKNATGSHPMIINANNFDNLYKSSIKEFF